MTYPKIKKDEEFDVFDIYSTCTDVAIARHDIGDGSLEFEVGRLIDEAVWNEDKNRFEWDSEGIDPF